MKSLNRSLSSLLLFGTLLSLSACPTAPTGEISEGVQATETLPPKESIRYEDYIYEQHVRTVQFYRGEDELAYPILYLNDPTTNLTIEFDELIDRNVRESDLWVSVVSCDYNWEPSQLLPMEFLDGFTYERIWEFRRSENTVIPYVHYSHKFPGENTKFKRAGNYLLTVYRNGDEKDLLLTRRFIVADNRLQIEPLMGKSWSASERFKLQRIDFNIYPGALNLMDPRQELEVVLLQNGRWDNAVRGLEPLYFTDKKLEYQFNAGTEFPGGNEYRRMDIRTFRFNAEGVYASMPTDSITHVQLVSDRPRLSRNYFSAPDFNGNYFIQVQEYPNADFDADYALVHFRLEYPEPITDGEVHVSGNLTGWQCTEESKMEYNAAEYRYETTLLLKQGYYNYNYIIDPYNGDPKDETRLEGSHYETENYYTILVYYKPITARCAELVGMSHVNYFDR